MESGTSNRKILEFVAYQYQCTRGSPLKLDKLPEESLDGPPLLKLRSSVVLRRYSMFMSPAASSDNSLDGSLEARQDDAHRDVSPPFRETVRQWTCTTLPIPDRNLHDRLQQL